MRKNFYKDTKNYFNDYDKKYYNYYSVSLTLTVSVSVSHKKPV